LFGEAKERQVNYREFREYCVTYRSRSDIQRQYQLAQAGDDPTVWRVSGTTPLDQWMRD